MNKPLNLSFIVLTESNQDEDVVSMMKRDKKLIIKVKVGGI